MNIIKKIRFLWKVWTRTLSAEDFSSLLALTADFFSTSADKKVATRLLKTYFKHPLTQNELNSLGCVQYLEAQDIWLNALRNRKMTDTEQSFLVRHMPWNILRRFPQELSYPYITVLFAVRDPQKIVAYCRDFDLLPMFEKSLILKYRSSLKQEDPKMFYCGFGNSNINGWSRALEAYLEGTGKRLMSKDVQQMLLDLKDEKILQKLILRCNIVHNCLYRDTIKRLIKENNVEAMRLLLRESYLPSDMADLLAKHMPQLIKQCNIADHRRLVYEKEQKEKTFMGALTFNEREFRLVLKHFETSPQAEKKFEEIYIEPFLGTFGPCMHAYIAYHFPDLIDKIVY